MLTIANTTRQKPLSTEADFKKIKEAVLGKTYELSLVFTGKALATSLNKKYRNKSYSPNVLSFPIDKTAGEIYINLDRIKIECKNFDMSPKTYIKYLFIHGLLHLKGLDHGPRMDALEKKFLQTTNY